MINPFGRRRRKLRRVYFDWYKRNWFTLLIASFDHGSNRWNQAFGTSEVRLQQARTPLHVALMP